MTLQLTSTFLHFSNQEVQVTEMESPELGINLSTLYKQNTTCLIPLNNTQFLLVLLLAQRKKSLLVPYHTSANTPLLIVWSFDQIEQYVQKLISLFGFRMEAGCTQYEWNQFLKSCGQGKTKQSKIALGIHSFTAKETKKKNLKSHNITTVTKDTLESWCLIK